MFVYKLGLEWGDKKSICNKFTQSSPVVALTWPAGHKNEVVFGMASGKVKVGQLRNNKSATLYSSESYVVSACSAPDGHAILTGHLDGTIYKFQFSDSYGRGPAHSKFCVHGCPPYALAWGSSVSVAGSDRCVTFYDASSGRVVDTFDHTADDGVKEFTVAKANPSGECVAIGNFDAFYVYGYNSDTAAWEERGTKKVPNYYTVTALA